MPLGDRPELGQWYDKQGQPLDLYKANDLLGDPEYKQVAEDIFVMRGEPVRVSTVWLGLNHRWTPGPPLIFETMIFGGSHDLQCWRYPTEQEALEGHREAITLLQLELGVLDEHDADDVHNGEHRDRPDPD